MAAEERYQEWLERLEVPVEAQATIQRFTDYLLDELLYSDAQIDALVSRLPVKIGMEEVGIKAVRIEYRWGVEIRYGVKGFPGLWGFPRAREFYERFVEEEAE